MVGEVPPDLVVCISEQYQDVTEINATWVMKHPAVTNFVILPKDLRIFKSTIDFIASKRRFETLHLVFDSKVPEAQFEVHVTFPYTEQLAEKRKQ